MSISQHSITQGQITKASFIGVAIVWAGVTAWSAFATFTGSSRDIAIAMFPAATVISGLVALLLFWPLTIALARTGTALARTQPWARRWWAWAAIGAIVGALALAAFMGVLSSWSAEIKQTATLGALCGAVSAAITFFRLGVARGA